MTGLAAIIVIDVLGIGAAWASQQSGIVGQFGKAFGAVVPYKG